MIFKMYSIKDELSGYMPPVPWIKEELAIRDFKDHMELNQKYKNNPEDYNFYYMGTFDTESGTIINENKQPKLIKKGVDYIGSSKTEI